MNELLSRRNKKHGPNISIKPYISVIKLLTILKPMLQGKKTYVVGVMTILGYIASYLVGDVSLTTILEPCITAILAMTIRNGIASK